MNSSTHCNGWGAPLFRKRNGGCHPSQNSKTLEINSPKLLCSSAKWPRIHESEAHTLTWKLIEEQLLFGSGDCSSVRAKGFPDHKNKVLRETSSPVSHQATYTVLEALFPDSPSLFWFFNSTKVSMNSIISFKKTPFLFKSWILLLAVKSPDWYICLISYSLNTHVTFTRALFELDFSYYCLSSSHTAWHTLAIECLLNEWFLAFQCPF